MSARRRQASARKVKPRPKANPQWPAKELLADVRALIIEARQRVAQTVNAGLTLLYWMIGSRIRQEILKEKRAEYGAEIVHSLSGQLTAEFGPGFGRTNLFNMVRFADVFPDLRIVQSLTAQLGWTQFRQIIYLDDPLKRDFYAEMCRLEKWNTRTLSAKIQSMLFERTALSKKPDNLIRQGLNALREENRLTPDLVFRDPYVLDFLGLQNTYAEKDIEAAILREMESFILELGVGFCFVARQKRMQIDHEDYYLDLLFYHRKLRRLVAVELKIGDFRAADKGQMELYLAWLKRHECDPGEESPIGLILCAGKNEQHVELLEPNRSGIHVASYRTKAFPKAELEKKLREAVRVARSRLENRRKMSRTPKVAAHKRLREFNET
jgi:predicted nuclease of restriction endonuclease-like (RecB) superfamily